MSDCSNHKKDILGETDMRVLAKAIGDLHYETLAELLEWLAVKFEQDGLDDHEAGRIKLADQLFYVHHAMRIAQFGIEKAWEISKPFMPNAEQNAQASDTTEAK